MGGVSVAIAESRTDSSFAIKMSSHDINENTGLLADYTSYDFGNDQGCCQSMICKCCGRIKSLFRLFILAYNMLIYIYIYIYIYISVISICVPCIAIRILCLKLLSHGSLHMN